MELNGEPRSRNRGGLPPRIIPEFMKCGYLCWRPDWLQKLNKPQWLLVVVSLASFTQGFVINGINNVNVSTLERRFDMSATSVAWISSSYDMMAGILCLVFGYIGMFNHKGRIIGGSCLVMSLGSFVMFLPHLLAGNYTLGPGVSQICDLSGNITDYCSDYTTTYSYLPVFICGQLLHGVGGAALYTLAIPYMDENIIPQNTALYIGIMNACAALGSSVGYAVGGAFLTIYVDVGRVDMDSVELSNGDPGWVGAWWIGFLISFGFSIILGLLFFCFPEKLATASKVQGRRKSEAFKGAGDMLTASASFGLSWRKDMIYSFKLIFSNPTWTFLTIGGVIESVGVVGITTFLPKIIEFQFSQTNFMAAVYSGIVVVLGAAGGNLVGGILPRYMKLQLRGLVTQCMCMSLIAVGLVFVFLLRCDTSIMAGVNYPYFNKTYGWEDNYGFIDHPCNSPCNCTTSYYNPICGQDGVQYFTPCFAGCQESHPDDTYETVYSNCSCIGEVDPTRPLGHQAIDGICPVDCGVLSIFLWFFFLLNVVTFMSVTAGEAATIRCVPDRERTFAAGVQATLARYFGNVPGPIILGLLFDRACWLWQSTCGREGACWIYSVEDLSWGITFLGVVVKGGSFVAFFFALILYKPPPEEEPVDTKDTRGMSTLSAVSQISKASTTSKESGDAFPQQNDFQQQRKPSLADLYAPQAIPAFNQNAAKKGRNGNGVRFAIEEESEDAPSDKVVETRTDSEYNSTKDSLNGQDNAGYDGGDNILTTEL